MKKFASGSLFAAILLLMSCAQSKPDAQIAGTAPSVSVQREGPYVYCNVYLQDACFGVGAGDGLEMQIPVDFSIYRVSLAGGARAEIYYGTSPALPKVVEGEKVWRSDDGEFRRFEVDDAAGGTQANYVYKPANSKVGNVVHIKIFADETRGNIVKSFIENFRPCRASGPSLQCRDSKLFVSEGGP